MGCDVCTVLCATSVYTGAVNRVRVPCVIWSVAFPRAPRGITGIDTSSARTATVSRMTTICAASVIVISIVPRICGSVTVSVWTRSGGTSPRKSTTGGATGGDTWVHATRFHSIATHTRRHSHLMAIPPCSSATCQVDQHQWRFHHLAPTTHHRNHSMSTRLHY